MGGDVEPLGAREGNADREDGFIRFQGVVRGEQEVLFPAIHLSPTCCFMPREDFFYRAWSHTAPGAGGLTR